VEEGGNRRHAEAGLDPAARWSRRIVWWQGR
jgi:hypothetical protein